MSTLDPSMRDEEDAGAVVDTFPEVASAPTDELAAEDAPVGQEAAAEEPVVEAAEVVAEESVAEEVEVVPEEPVAEEVVAELLPAAEEVLAEEVVAEEPAAEAIEVVAEEPAAEEILAEEVLAEEVVAELPVAAEIIAEPATEEISEELATEDIVAEPTDQLETVEDAETTMSEDADAEDADNEEDVGAEDADDEASNSEEAEEEVSGHPEDCAAEEEEEDSEGILEVVHSGAPSEGFEFVQTLPADSKLCRKYGFKYVCCREYSFLLPCGIEATVPVGFLTDGCTCGFSRLGERQWLVHDWLYAMAGLPSLDAPESCRVTRAQADGVFWRWPQYHRWLGVRIFGGAYWGEQSIAANKRVQPDLVQ